MSLFSQKLFKRDYLQMVLKEKVPFLRRGRASIRKHPMRYPHWPNFWGMFYEIFIDDNYRIDGLTDVRTIIDAGANIGVSAVYFAQTYPAAHVDCFEPNPESLPYLRDNVASYKNVTVHPYALGVKEGTIPFYVDTETQGSSMASAVDFLQAKKRSAKEISVEMKKLSEHITGPVDILKVDIEGGEMPVMEDLIASGKLSQVRVILMEFHYDPKSLTESVTRLLTLLEANGFFFYIRRGAMVTSPSPAAHAYMLFAFRK